MFNRGVNRRKGITGKQDCVYNCSLSSALVVKAATAMDLDYSFDFRSYDGKYCSDKTITIKPGNFIKKIKLAHRNGKSNKDVEEFDIKNHVMGIIPRNIGTIFCVIICYLSRNDEDSESGNCFRNTCILCFCWWRDRRRSSENCVFVLWSSRFFL